MSNDFVIYSEPALIRVGMSTDRPTSPMSIREVWIDTDTANGYKAKYESGTGLVWESLASGGGSIQLTDLTDVLTAAYTNGFVLVANGTQYVGRALTESDISDLGSYLTSVDLTTDVTGILPVLNGGTGSSTASGARTNLDAEQTISGRTLPSATVAADDKVIIQDTSGSDSEATVTAQSIADLATSAVTSVFTRAGAIVAATGDYDASQVDNDSTVVGAQVSDALNTLNSGKSDVGHTHLLSAITDAGALASKDFVGYDDLDSDLDSMSGLYNGTTLDPTTMDVTSDGSTVTFSIEKSGGGDVRIKFSDGIHTHDCTPAAELTLTAGTDSVPVQNYIYIDQATLTLSTSTAGWPSSEHAKLGKAFVQSASGVQNRGVLKFHAWSDHTYSSDGGHVQHLNSWIRHQVATWEEGVLCTPTVGSSQLDLSTSIGEVLQLHEHGFPALDTSTDGCFVVNDSAASYSWTDDLSTKLTDASGGSLSAKYYNLVLWGVVSEDAGDCHLMINLPTGSYTTEASAIDDNDNTAVYTIPGDFRGTGFLIARLTVRHQTAGNTFSISQNEDLRGKLPSISAGGTVGGGAEQLSDLTDVGDTTPTDKNVLVADGDSWESRALVVADISDAGALAALNTVGSTQIDDSSVTIAKLSATGTASATTYLRGDGAWATPSGSGDVSGVGSSTDNAIARWNGVHT